VIAFAAAALYGWKWYVLKPTVEQQSRVVQNVFPFIFWGTALLFGAMHAVNFAPGFPIWAMPVVVLPLIFVGEAHHVSYTRHFRTALHQWRQTHG